MTYENVPSVKDRELASVSEQTAFTGDSHASKGRAAEVEVGAPIRAVTTRALICHNYCDGSSRTDALVETLDFVTRPAPPAILEQHWAHRPNPRPVRLHVHH